MSHIMVIFDCSGSMGECFQALKKRNKQAISQNDIKIEAAKSSLMSWLSNSEFDIITIIPFSTRTRKKFTTHRDKSSQTVSFIQKQVAGGNTNLQAAISQAMKIALNDKENSYIQYLIVTDGLSQTIEQDLKLVQKIPIKQGVSGILIDPTVEGEKHMRRLCVRGSYMSVTGFTEFKEILGKQEKTYTERIKLSKSISKLKAKNLEVTEKISKSQEKIKIHPAIQKEIDATISASLEKADAIKRNQEDITSKIADQNVDLSQINDDISKIELEQSALDAIVNLLANYDQLLQQVKISVLHPRFLAKGHTTTLFVHIYPIDDQIKNLNKEIRNLGAARKLYSIVLTTGMNATTKLLCQDIDFSNEITRKLARGKNILEFKARPKESTRAGTYEATLITYNKNTEKIYTSQTIKFELVDYIFGSVPRPFVHHILISLFWFSSFVLAVCTILGILNVLAGSLASISVCLLAITQQIILARLYKVRDIVK